LELVAKYQRSAKLRYSAIFSSNSRGRCSKFDGLRFSMVKGKKKKKKKEMYEMMESSRGVKYI